jgi:hypothetical protein
MAVEQGKGDCKAVGVGMDMVHTEEGILLVVVGLMNWVGTAAKVEGLVVVDMRAQAGQGYQVIGANHPVGRSDPSG